ncbi:hypothetical protein DSO57_1006402 [Entomophthora muscae]|uniref:Uncharacterized protein n=1 Tax=Entomophthora muscae TaxID=34485 RepID=A0ACC2TJ82_9FUNG|nr:hypothetical protein DSO57_1006402 [Entomophthora muscae]
MFTSAQFLVTLALLIPGRVSFLGRYTGISNSTWDYGFNVAVGLGSYGTDFYVTQAPDKGVTVFESNANNQIFFTVTDYIGSPSDLHFGSQHVAYTADGFNTVYKLSGVKEDDHVQARVHCRISPTDTIVDITKANNVGSGVFFVAANRYAKENYAKGVVWVCAPAPAIPYVQAILSEEISSLDSSPDDKLIYILTKSNQTGKRIVKLDSSKKPSGEEQQMPTLVSLSSKYAFQNGRVRVDKKGNIYAAWMKKKFIHSFNPQGNLLNTYYFPFVVEHLAIGGGSNHTLAGSGRSTNYASGRTPYSSTYLHSI